MAGTNYLSARRKYGRPQGLLLSNEPGEVVTESGTSFYVPQGTEFQDFIVLSDHNRQEIQITPERIETRKRMINGRMRSYWLADKSKISTSWKMLPSRSSQAGPDSINTNTGAVTGQAYVVDRGAAGADLLKWYESHKGSFYVWIAYDKPDSYDEKYFKHYAEIKECFFSSFNYSVAKRSGIFDFWDISIELEEA